MTERDEVLREIRQLEYVWIPLRDGTQLAARVWLPVDAEQVPCRPSSRPCPTG